MKTRLYTLLIGLLMAFCITSYGQEIIGEITHSNGLMNTNCQIVEAADGNLLVGFNVYHEDNTANFAVFKYTPDGELLDSLTFPNRSELWAANPLDPETQVYASFVTEDAATSVKITFIGSDFSVTNNLLVPIPNYDESCINLDGFFFDTQNDIIISYWKSNLFHFARIGLDGTLKDDKEIEGLYTPINRPDTTVYYIRSRLVNTSPQQFSLLGDIQNNYRWPLIGYFFDNDFNLIDKHIYQLIKQGILADGGMGEHITAFDEESYLLAARIQSGNYGYAGLIKFSRADHEPLQIQLFEGNDPYRFNVEPGDTKVLDNHDIYFTYKTHVSTNNNVAFLRTTPNLDQIWKVTIPEIPQQVFGGTKITVLRDGRIVLGTVVYKEDYTKTDLHIYIIHDGYDATPETIIADPSFTLYPNPVKDQLSLRFDGGIEPESVELYDLTGRMVGTKPNGLESMDMSAMSSGMYMLRVTMKDGTCYHEKILKE
jgi:hypothetical protein